tara:strand:- start:2498 stop:3088 length:591 start_codon:yes stop_codon:yes gene_type:complete
MSAPIPIIKKEENTGGYFASWFKKQKDKENIEEEIFEMSDDELPPKLKPNPPKEEDLDDVDDSADELPDELQQDNCFGFPCTNNKYHGYCKRCDEDSICSLMVESVQQGFYDMKDDIKCLWQRDVVKVWTVFLTVCYFNIPTEAMFAGAFYYMNKKFEDHEKKITSQSTLPPVTDSETDEDEEQDEEQVEETKKCV